jgi:hypothetical protein
MSIKIEAQMLLSTILKGLQAQDRRVYTNLQLQAATQRFEDSIKLHKEARTPSQQELLKEPKPLQDLNCELRIF